MRHGDEAADVASFVVSHSDEAADLAQTAKKVDPCSFAAGTEVMTLAGPVPVEHVRQGDRVLAYTGDVGQAVTVEVRPRATAAARGFALAAALLGGAPEADAVVEAYDARTGAWVEQVADQVALGDEVRHDGHLMRRDAARWEDRGAVDAQVLWQARPGRRGGRLDHVAGAPERGARA